MKQTGKSKNKKRANVSIMVAVFCFAFLAFCAFSTDMAFITMNRAKLQRAVETTALASIARYAYDGYDNSEDYFNMYKSELDTIKDAQLVKADYKTDATGEHKVKISAQLVNPTYFLKFAGILNIRIEANSYAASARQSETEIHSEDIISSDYLITDKKGSEIKIKTNPNTSGYFVFVGIKDENNAYIWQDIGCKANEQTYLTNVGSNTYNMICSPEVEFDFSKNCTPKTDVNVAKYIKIYKANNGECQNATGTQEPPYNGDENYEIAILNNVKLITKDDF